METFLLYFPYICLGVFCVSFMAAFFDGIDEVHVANNFIAIVTVPTSLFYLYIVLSLNWADSSNGNFGAGFILAYILLFSLVASPVIIIFQGHAGWSLGHYCKSGFGGSRD